MYNDMHECVPVPTLVLMVLSHLFFMQGFLLLDIHMPRCTVLNYQIYLRHIKHESPSKSRATCAHPLHNHQALRACSTCLRLLLVSCQAEKYLTHHCVCMANNMGITNFNGLLTYRQCHFPWTVRQCLVL